MNIIRTHMVALRALLVATVLLGIVYPLVITGIGQVALPWQANGSMIERDGEVVGSAIIGQSFTDEDGAALPEYFQSRPSAAGDGYDASASSGSNYGPEHPDLIAAVEERRAAVAELEGIPVEEVPAEAVTASSSGLDPHISPEYALLQAPRVAEARGLDEQEVLDIVNATIQGRDLGFLGEPTVNVLQLNLALDDLEG